MSRRPVPEDLKALGVVQYAEDKFQDPRFETMEYLFSMRGYEVYDMDALKRDYKEWREERQKPKKWQDLMPEHPEDKEWEETYAKSKFRYYKRELRTYNTLVRWAKSNHGVGRDIYAQTKAGKPPYHLMRWGNLIKTYPMNGSIGAMATYIDESISRVKEEMKQKAKEEFVILPSSVREKLDKAHPLPTWIEIVWV